jgi:hypothetical protein
VAYLTSGQIAGGCVGAISLVGWWRQLEADLAAEPWCVTRGRP